MIAYLDSSALLRVVLGQPRAMAGFDTVAQGLTSRLTEVECFRTLDRARVRGELSEPKLSAARAAVIELLANMEILDLTSAVLRRAAAPMPTQITTLDAIHLASALLWSEATGETPTMATHDAALGLAARAHGLPVVGT